ncbi:MAG TPA: hypothetical protein VEG60_29675 [Candidatus Binatia bacterium]|nr:hypothetical protein [Candidatus Binatia bacterium]
MKIKVTSAVITIAFLLFAVGGSVLAQGVKEMTLKNGNNVIFVRTLAPAEVVSVKPYIDAKKGKKIGRLKMDVVLKNTADKPQSYSVFGQGKTDTGGWLGGVAKAPSKGKLEPGKEVTAEVTTRYEGEKVPGEMRLEVFSPQ